MDPSANRHASNGIVRLCGGLCGPTVPMLFRALVDSYDVVSHASREAIFHEPTLRQVALVRPQPPPSSIAGPRWCLCSGSIFMPHTSRIAIWLTLSMLLLGNGTRCAMEGRGGRTNHVNAQDRTADGAALPATSRSECSSPRKPSGDRAGYLVGSDGGAKPELLPLLDSIDRLTTLHGGADIRCTTDWRLPLRI